MKAMLAMIALLSYVGRAQAGERLWILTGDIYRHDYYVGGGLIFPFPGNNHLGQGWVVRPWIDSFSYSYLAGTTPVDARVLGAEAMIGYQASRSNLAAAAYLGVRYSNTRLSPDDPGGALRGEQVWPKAQVEIDAALSPSWRAGMIVAYTAVLDGYWTRLRLLYGLPAGRYVGPEVVAQGDPNYTAQKLGIAFGGIAASPHVFVTLKAGYRFQRSASAAYCGAELVGEF
jgi:hypothetical protein